MTLTIVVSLVNFCLLVVRSAEMLVKLTVELYQTIVLVTVLQNNEMPIGVDHFLRRMTFRRNDPTK